MDKLSAICWSEGNEQDCTLDSAASVAGKITIEKREIVKKLYERILVDDTNKTGSVGARMRRLVFSVVLVGVGV